jgi:hypothetical protein
MPSGRRPAQTYGRRDGPVWHNVVKERSGVLSTARHELQVPARIQHSVFQDDENLAAVLIIEAELDPIVTARSGQYSLED